MFKRHKLLNAVLFILFFIYVVSPLTASLNESRKYLAEETTFRAKDVAIFFIDFLYQVGIEDGDKESDTQDDENVIVKKKRAVIRKFDKVSIAKTAHISHMVTVELSSLPDSPNIDVTSEDHHASTKSFNGFYSLFSGVSPPIA